MQHSSLLHCPWHLGSELFILKESVGSLFASLKKVEKGLLVKTSTQPALYTENLKRRFFSIALIMQDFIKSHIVFKKLSG